MGKFKSRRKKGAGVKKEREDKPNEFKVDYKSIVQSNENLVNYYKSQNLMSDTELELMFETFKKALPTTFRITGSYVQASELLDTLETTLLPTLHKLEVDGEVVEPPSVLSWYPGRLGWQVSPSKGVLKKVVQFKNFHSFLVSESEVGNISRQEAVSMIPPLLLKVESWHKVLDMCAAPGSKTAQLMEALHSGGLPDEGKNGLGLPEGFILANDANPKRCFTLIHQIKRLKSPNFLVTNHEAQMFPNLKIDGDKVKFDRILCDVPCSGDGTLRKNYMIWKDWTVGQGLALHKLQLDILKRGLQMLKVGGKLVYSTCSINPIENEAVVAAALNAFDTKVKLVDCKDELVGLERRPGISNWKVYVKNDATVDKFADLSDSDAKKKWAVPSLFPPENINSLNIDRCLRIYPHLQNTGGFFVAVFEKIQPFNNSDELEVEAENYEVTDNSVMDRKTEDEHVDQKDIESQATEQKDIQVNEDAQEVIESPNIKSESSLELNCKVSKIGEEPFVFLKPESPELQNLTEHFQLKDFPTNLFLVRSFTDHNNTIHLVSPSVQKLLSQNSHSKLNLVNCGIKAFVRNSGQQKHTNKFRLQNEALTYIHHFLPNQIKLEILASDLLLLLEETNPLLNKFSEGVIEKVKSLDSSTTSVLATFDPNQLNLDDPSQPKLHLTSKAFHQFMLPVWKANVSLNLLLNIQEKSSLKLRLFGVTEEVKKSTDPTNE